MSQKTTEISLPLPNHVQALMRRLEHAGEEVYLVGGSLRDALLGLSPHDFDLATSAKPEKMLTLFSDYRVIPTGLKHGTVTVLSEGQPIEITTFRIDGQYTDTRHPDCVRFTDQITEDLSRRDFTVNAMAYHPSRGLIDPFEGRTDLQNKIIRTVRDPRQRLEEDALRIMRAFRFSAQLGFRIHSDTLSGLHQCRMGLEKIAPERIASEFLRLLLSPDPAPALRLMIQTEVLPYVTPGYCPDEQILQAFCRIPMEESAGLGLFFAKAPKDVILRSLHRLRCSNRQIIGACAVARGSAFAVNTESDARRLIADCGNYAETAVRVSILLGHSPACAWDWVANNTAACTLKELAVDGRDLIAIGLEPKQIGNVLHALLRAVLADPTQNQKEILLTLAKQYDHSDPGKIGSVKCEKGTNL